MKKAKIASIYKYIFAFFVNKKIDLTYNISKDNILTTSLLYAIIISERKGELDGTNISKYPNG